MMLSKQWSSYQDGKREHTEREKRLIASRQSARQERFELSHRGGLLRWRRLRWLGHVDDTAHVKS